MLIVNENTITLIIILLIIFLAFILIRTIFHIIKWFFSAIWYLLTGKKREVERKKSDYWLDKAQARQEIRFENSLPPLKQKAEPLKKTFREKRNERKGKSATGWTFNEETQLWEPPKNMKR